MADSFGGSADGVVEASAEASAEAFAASFAAPSAAVEVVDRLELEAGLEYARPAEVVPLAVVDPGC